MPRSSGIFSDADRGSGNGLGVAAERAEALGSPKAIVVTDANELQAVAFVVSWDFIEGRDPLDAVDNASRDFVTVGVRAGRCDALNPATFSDGAHLAPSTEAVRDVLARHRVHDGWLREDRDEHLKRHENPDRSTSDTAEELGVGDPTKQVLLGVGGEHR